MLLNRTTVIYIFRTLRCAVKRQLISLKYFETYHIDLHFLQRDREFFLYTLHLPSFSAEACPKLLLISKMESFYVII